MDVMCASPPEAKTTAYLKRKIAPFLRWTTTTWNSSKALVGEKSYFVVWARQLNL